MKTEREKNAPLMERMGEYLEQMRAAKEAAAFDEAAFRAIAAKRARIEVELAVLRVRTHQRLRAALTPEQRALDRNSGRPWDRDRGIRRHSPANVDRRGAFSRPENGREQNLD